MLNLYETYNSLNALFFIKCIVATDRKVNKTDILNQLRGVEGIVYIKVRQDERVDAKTSDTTEYTLLELKFIANKEAPKKTIESIKGKALKGDDNQKRIIGFKAMYLVNNTLRRVR